MNKKESDYKKKALACARIGDTCARSKDYPTALVWYKRACSLYEKHANGQHPHVGALLGQIARVHIRMEQYESARDAYQGAYNIQKRAFGASHPETIATYISLAGAYRLIKDYQSAILILVNTMSLQEKASDPSGILLTCNELATTFFEAGNKKMALNCLNRAIDKCAPDTAAYALTAYNLADYYFYENDIGEALKWYGQSYDAYYNADHICGAAGAAAGVAKSCAKLLNIREALEWGERALNLHRSYYGEETQGTAASHNNIAFFYQKNGQIDLAQEHYARALNTHIKLFGEEHILTARSYSNIAGIYQSKSEHEKALEYYTRALDILRGQPHESKEEASLCNNIAETYHSKGDHENATRWYHDAAKLSLD